MSLDYVIPLLGAKKSGASRAGITFSIVGMVLGIFIFPPWGIIFGAFIGGIAGELLSGKGGKEALKVGWGIFIGNMLSTGIKLAYSLVVIFYYVKALIYQ